jgi:uracil-DNA glycosylase family 4
MSGWGKMTSSRQDATQAALPTARVERQQALIVLQARLSGCHRCEERGYLAQACPVTGAPALARVLIIGQAPGLRSQMNHLPFSGPGGRVLQSWLVRAGFAPEDFRTRVYFSSLTRCYPGRSPRGNGDRRPSPEEIALCRPYLEEELQIIQPRVVLLVGSMAIATFIGPASLEQVIGSCVEREGRFWLPLPHPSGVSRWLNAPAHQALLEQALAHLARWRVTYALDRENSAPAHGSLPEGAARTKR